MSGKTHSSAPLAAALVASLSFLPPLTGDGRAAEATAELGAGGLAIARNDVLELLSQDIFISAGEVRTTYRFRNKTDKAATFLVSVPLPVLDAADGEEAAPILPKPGSDNFLDVQLSVDGKTLTPQMEQYVTALGVDRAGELRSKELPFNPLASGVAEKIAALSPDDQSALHRLGLLIPDGAALRPGWRLDAAFHWQQAFPAGKEVVIEHKYKPVVGTGLFGTEDLRQGFYRARYCMDADFSRVAGGRLAAVRTSDMPYLDEMRLSYTHSRFGGWPGIVRSFRLVVDKGEADAVVSFCGSGIRRISANQFELTARNFSPDREINVLIVRPRKAK